MELRARLAACSRCTAWAVLALAVACPAGAQSRLPAAAPPACNAPAELARFARPMPRLAERLAHRQAVTIVAIGSSSTSGAGASSSSASYPSRLEVMLRAKFPDVRVTVLNRGINGEEVADMLTRLDRGVIAEKPDLVLWQLGTNSVLRDHDLASNALLVAEGLRRLKATGADIVLIDPQFAPKVIARAGAEAMVRMISAAAKEGNVALFHRFAAMRYWREVRSMPFETFLATDQLHMNDWGYNCVAQLLADAIEGAATRVPQTASAPGIRGQ